MQYKHKDIVTSIIPGVVMLSTISVFFFVCSSYQSIMFKEINGLELTGFFALFTLFSIIVGYIIGCVASLLERSLLKRPRIGNNTKGANDPNLIVLEGCDQVDKDEIWHFIKDTIDVKDRIEDNYIRFAQARNMATSFFLTPIVSFFYLVISGKLCQCLCLYILLLLAYWIITGLIFRTCKRHHSRYYQVILAEYNKKIGVPLNPIYQNKDNNVDDNSIHKEDKSKSNESEEKIND